MAPVLALFGLYVLLGSSRIIYIYAWIERRQVLINSLQNRDYSKFLGNNFCSLSFVYSVM